MTLPRIIVVAAPGLASKAIEDFGGWSHMGNLLTDDTVLDARADRMTFGGKTIEAGVQLRPAHYLDSEPRWAIYEFGTEEMYGAWAMAGLKQIGKPYDMKGINRFGEGLITGDESDSNYNPLNPASSTAWFCDELSIYMAWQCRYFNLPAGYLPFLQTPGAALNLFLGAGAKLIASKS
jgi:hypothetical protein